MGSNLVDFHYCFLYDLQSSCCFAKLSLCWLWKSNYGGCCWWGCTVFAGSAARSVSSLLITDNWAVRERQLRTVCLRHCRVEWLFGRSCCGLGPFWVSFLADGGAYQWAACFQAGGRREAWRGPTASIWLRLRTALAAPLEYGGFLDGVWRESCQGRDCGPARRVLAIAAAVKTRVSEAGREAWAFH